MKQMHFLSLLGFGLFALAGCTTERSVIENDLKETALPVATSSPPKTGLITYNSKTIVDTIDNYYQEEDAYKTAVNGNNTVSQTTALKLMTMDRDEIVYYYLMIIENFYATERRQLIDNTDWAVTGGDIVQLGLTSAATLVGGPQTKAILAAIATGINGSTLSIDKNILNNGSVEIVTARMQALIESKAGSVTTNLTGKKADTYSLRQAVLDLVDVYNCGSFAYAMQDIRNTASIPSTNAAPVAPKTPAKA